MKETTIKRLCRDKRWKFFLFYLSIFQLHVSQKYIIWVSLLSLIVLNRKIQKVVIIWYSSKKICGGGYGGVSRTRIAIKIWKFMDEIHVKNRKPTTKINNKEKKNLYQFLRLCGPILQYDQFLRLKYKTSKDVSKYNFVGSCSIFQLVESLYFSITRICDISFKPPESAGKYHNFDVAFATLASLYLQGWHLLGWC